MPNDNPVPAARDDLPALPLPEAHQGHYMIYVGPAQEEEWIPCRFVLAPPELVVSATALRASYARAEEPDGQTVLDADGVMHVSPDTADLPPLGVMVFPATTPVNPAPVPFAIPVSSLDAVGIRATIEGVEDDVSIDIQSPAGRRHLADNAAKDPGLARDVANWAAALGARNPTQLPPRLGAGLMIDRIAREQEPTRLPEGVTLDGLARWRQMQWMRAELRDDRTPSLCHRSLQQLADESTPVERRAQAMPASAVLDEILKQDVGIQASTAALVREAFAPLTKAPVESISCVHLGLDTHPMDVETSARHLEWERIDEGWSSAAIQEVTARLARVMPNYDAQMQLLTRTTWTENAMDGAAADMLLVFDRWGAYAYSWPTADRQDSLASEIDDVPMVAAADIPSVEAVQEMMARVAARRALIDAELEDGEDRPAPLPAPEA